MKCPHCLESYHPQTTFHCLEGDAEWWWNVIWQQCPSCSKYVIELEQRDQIDPTILHRIMLVYPKAAARTPPPQDVPPVYAQDYREACLVLTDSPKASAALSRRCLQNLLRDKAKVKPSSLSAEIDEVMKSDQLPSHLNEAIDAIRNIGNFASHPTKSTNTREILEVEDGEAEWLLDILEGLFDFYFTQPAILGRKRDALNAKLQEAGKPPMKSSVANP